MAVRHARLLVVVAEGRSFDGGVWKDAARRRSGEERAAGRHSSAPQQVRLSRGRRRSRTSRFLALPRGRDARHRSRRPLLSSDESDPSKAASTAAWRPGRRAAAATRPRASRGAAPAPGRYILPACLRGDRRGISRDDDGGCRRRAAASFALAAASAANRRTSSSSSSDESGTAAGARTPSPAGRGDPRCRPRGLRS